MGLLEVAEVLDEGALVDVAVLEDVVVDGAGVVVDVVDAAGETVERVVLLAAGFSLAAEHPESAAMTVAIPAVALMLRFMECEFTGGTGCYPVTR